MIFDSAGNIYGTTTLGGGNGNCNSLAAGCGTVFKLAAPASEGAAWTETVLHSFPSKTGDGSQPSGGVIFGEKGLLFGVTLQGGRSNIGAAYAVAK